MTSIEPGSNVTDATRPPRPIRIWRTYLLIWLAAFVPLLGFHGGLLPHYIKASWRLCAALANLFGPFATFVLRLSDFPNGGEFHKEYLPYACAATAAMAVIMLLPLAFRQRWARIGCIAVFVPILLFWLALGVMEIIGCAL